MDFAGIRIEPASLDEAVELEREIPEFDFAKLASEGRARLEGRLGLVLIAWCDGEPVGLKVGYALDETEFYSWVGGVRPAWRGQGIARMLLETQEEWARLQGFRTIRVKSRSCFPGMLRLLIAAGYRIVGHEPGDDELADRIHFRKSLHAA